MKQSAKAQPPTATAKPVKITVYGLECAKTAAGDPLQYWLSSKWPLAADHKKATAKA